MCWIWGRDFRKKPSARSRGSGSDIFPELAGSSVRWPVEVCSARHRHRVPSVCTVVPLPTQPQKVLLSVGAHREVDWDEQSTWQCLRAQISERSILISGTQRLCMCPYLSGTSRVCPSIIAIYIIFGPNFPLPLVFLYLLSPPDQLLPLSLKKKKRAGPPGISLNMA